MTTQKIWKEAYSETVLDFTERNPDPSDWVRGERTDEAQRMRDALTADISEIPTEDLVTIDLLTEWWNTVVIFSTGRRSALYDQVVAGAFARYVSKKHCYHKPK